MRTFTDLTTLTPAGEGRFEASVHPLWTIAGKPNGGYLAALLGRSAVAVAAQPHVLAASLHYLRSPDPGPVVIEVEVLRSGRSASQLRSRLRQADAVCVEALLTVGTLPDDATTHWSGGVPDPVSTDPDSAEHASAHRVPGTNPAGLPVPIMDQVDARIDDESWGFASGRPSGRGELRGWLALPEGERFDPVSLLYAVDAFPPATLDIELTGWVPTLELTVYVRALPAPGPVRLLQKANLIEAQRVDEQCWAWDSRGRVVAHATQLAGIRLG